MRRRSTGIKNESTAQSIKQVMYSLGYEMAIITLNAHAQTHTHNLHVRNLALTFDRSWIHGEQILSTRFLPFIKAATFKGRYSHLAKIFSLVSVPLLGLFNFPLSLRHTRSLSQTNTLEQKKKRKNKKTVNKKSLIFSFSLSLYIYISQHVRMYSIFNELLLPERTPAALQLLPVMMDCPEKVDDDNGWDENAASATAIMRAAIIMLAAATTCNDENFIVFCFSLSRFGCFLVANVCVYISFSLLLW